ncbi:MAG: phosphoribosyl 1,2-cyclic phosphodiesterase [Lentimonas sp.]|jgi:phosphoribosyl 1,2-cyclic phosphodiesterase
MLANFQILGSSSSGNCALLKTEQSTILVDVGFSAKRIGELLAAVGESLDNIDAVFLTHEHNDHAQGVRGLAKRADLPIFANRDTADAVQAKLTKRPNWQIFQTGTTFKFRDLSVHSISIPHDAYDPVGYTFHWGESGDLFNPPRGLAWITDLGYVPAHVREHMATVDTLVLEANYDETLLENDEKRPHSTKQRIRGRHGHLSNDEAYEVLRTLNGNSILREVFIAHLSKDCNTISHVQEKFAPLHCEKSFKINIVDPISGLHSASKKFNPAIQS